MFNIKKNYPGILDKKNEELKLLKIKYQNEKDPNKKIQYMQNYIVRNDIFWSEFAQMSKKSLDVYNSTVAGYKIALLNYEKQTSILLSEIKKM